jgi:hypothetical protein
MRRSAKRCDAISAGQFCHHRSNCLASKAPAPRAREEHVGSRRHLLAIDRGLDEPNRAAVAEPSHRPAAPEVAPVRGLAAGEFSIALLQPAYARRRLVVDEFVEARISETVEQLHGVTGRQRLQAQSLGAQRCFAQVSTSRPGRNKGDGSRFAGLPIAQRPGLKTTPVPFVLFHLPAKSAAATRPNAAATTPVATPVSAARGRSVIRDLLSSDRERQTTWLLRGQLNLTYSKLRLAGPEHVLIASIAAQ